MRSLTRRETLALAGALGVSACSGGGPGTGTISTPSPTPTPAPPVTPSPTPTPTPTPTTTLAAAAAAKRMRFGSTFNWAAPGADAGSFNNPSYAALLERDCQVLVPENEMKWEYQSSAENVYDWTRADQMLAYAESKGMEMRGHCFLWYIQERFPAWLRSYPMGADPRATAERLVRTHVQNTARHFGNRIKSWDVINEAVDPATGNVRTNILHNAVGGDTSILDLAFRTARAELPTAELVYNDYMDWGSTTHRNGVLALLQGFRTRGVPVDALGIQSHIGFYSSGTAQDIANAQIPAMRSFLDAVVALGYKLIITEFDVNDRNRTGTVAQRDEDVAVYGRAWLDLLFSYPQLKDVLVWGMNDKYSWLQNFGTPRPDGQPLRPCPYDASAQPKRFYTAIGEAFAATTARPAPT
ncbi:MULTISPECIES: endo-1,4-beta-xylanase [unclassified Sphingomonas]|uniref:endo-1,4-beta-xylanase n=1 Tax=unclassified Sphingomonas TaxID=196159 RepID=UPI002151F38F|nr:MULTISPECIES: endo-1,4-beta-xylanase [unclassified Sphingomonas]MCR5869617.1 endo-1,4-beta-xylanase [Sphingomonas sp. J344]UUX98666.1 endo-1,4-beta-xylanase [Sphingomonas sp. J315]